jgi:hypothetical protein
MSDVHILASLEDELGCLGLVGHGHIKTEPSRSRIARDISEWPPATALWSGVSSIVLKLNISIHASF